jgi:hypothetical protein
LSRCMNRQYRQKKAQAQRKTVHHGFKFTHPKERCGWRWSKRAR